MAVHPQTPPLFSIFKEPNKTEPKHRAQRPKRTPRHAMRASAVADKTNGLSICLEVWAEQILLVGTKTA